MQHQSLSLSWFPYTVAILELLVSERGVGGRGCSGFLLCRWHMEPPGAAGRTHISLDRVSGRLLDKDHNMTLFLLCRGSANRRRASTAPPAFVLGIDHTSCLPFRWQKSTCPFLFSCHFEAHRFFFFQLMIIHTPSAPCPSRGVPH